MWNLPAPPGFVGLDDKRPLRYYRRHLPHWRQEGVTYFVTFRLADSLPKNKLDELARLRDEWHRATASLRNGLPSDGRTRQPSFRQAEQRFAREVMLKVEEWLDAGSGSCLLKESWAANEVRHCLHFQDDKYYELCAYVIMPNHVHLLARPFSDQRFPLERLEQGWKSFSSLAINRHRGGTGTLWQEESFDRIVRDEEHLWRCLQYIGSNPRRAGLPASMCLRYVREAWQRVGWNFVDDEPGS